MRKSARRTAVLAGGVAVVAAAAVAGVWVSGSDDRPTESAGAAAPSSATGSAPSGTPSAATAGAAASTSGPPPVDEVATDPAPVRTGGEVDPMITHAGWEDASASVEVNGFVAGVVELDGTCRLTLTRGSDVVVAENPAEADASTMGCGLLQVAGADLLAGTWTVVLSYESATSAGESPAVEVEVPAR